MPGLLLDGDHNDPQLLDRARALGQLESFLEVVAGRKSGVA